VIVTIESTAAPSAHSEERQHVPAAAPWFQTGKTEKYPVAARSGFWTFVVVVLENIKLLLVGPLVVGLVAFGITSFVPKWYTSVAYLNLDEAGARAADARMRSTPVLDKVLAGFKVPQGTLEARRKAIEENRRIIVAPGETQKTSKLFRMEYSDESPSIAQKVNSLLIEAWLDSTKPAPDRRAAIEAEIERTDAQAKSISQLTDRLQKDAPSLVAQSLQGELATPILGLITKRDEDLSNLIALKNSLNGLSRDVLFGAPDLPEEASWPKRGIVTILAAVAAELLLLLFVIVHRLKPAWI
jgi:hypothetical protein